MTSLDDALSAPNPAWLAPKVHTDWRGFAYGGDGSYDDLSGQAGQSFTVVQSIEDGMPDPLTATSGATASGTLSLPDVLGRYGLDLAKITNVGVQGQQSANNSAHAPIGTYSPSAAMSCDYLLVAWRSETPGAGSRPYISQLPPGYEVIVPQVTDGDLNAVLLASKNHDTVKVVTTIDMYFSEAVDWMYAPVSWVPHDKFGGWMPVKIDQATGVVGSTVGTPHTVPLVTVGADGNSGGNGMALWLSYGSGGDWTAGTYSGHSAVGKFAYSYNFQNQSGLSAVAKVAGTAYAPVSNTALPAGPSLQTNDGTFETFAGWTPTGGTFAQSTAQAHAGTHSGILTVVGSVTQAFFRSNQIAVTAGATYRSWVWALATTSMPNVGISIDWFTSLGAYISTTSTTGVTLVANTWTRLDTGPITAPATAAFGSYGGTLGGSPAAGKIVYFDDVDFRGMEVIMMSWVMEADEFDNMDGRQFFSPYNEASPIRMWERDIPPLSLQQGIMTDDGSQYTTIFTGQMSGISTTGRQADIEGVSATRLAMMQSVLLPLVNGATAGANMTWPVTYLMAASLRFASPRPSVFARYWATLHGSWMYNLGAAPNVLPSPTFNTYFNSSDLTQNGAGVGQINNAQPTAIDGPFVLGMYSERRSDRGIMSQTVFGLSPTKFPGFDPGDEYLHTGLGRVIDVMADNVSGGRFSCWVKGDSQSVDSSAEWAITPSLPGLVRYTQTLRNASNVPIAIVEVGLQAKSASGMMYVRLRDNSGHDTVGQNTLAIPFDDGWHFCSWTWIWATGQSKIYIDGVEAIVPNATIVSTDIPSGWTEAIQNANGWYTTCEIDAYVPIAEAMVETGGNGTTFPDLWQSAYQWSAATPFAPTAIVRPLPYNLSAIIETAPSDAWTLLVRYAQASLSAYRCDELDRICFLPAEYFGEPLLTPFASDAFGRTVASSWGTADLGGDWTESGSNFTVAPGSATIQVSADNVLYTSVLASDPVQDFDIRATSVPTALATGSWFDHYILGRYVDSTHYMGFYAAYQTDGTVDAFISVNKGGGEIPLASNIFTAVKYTSASVMNIRAKAVGPAVMMKIWPSNVLEPEDWLLVAEDVAPVTGPIGLAVLATAGNTNAKPFTTGFGAFSASFEEIEVLDTEINAQDLAVTVDPSKIRNDVTVQFMDTNVSTLPIAVFQGQTATSISKKVSTQTFSLSGLQVQTLSNTLFANLTASQITAGTFPASQHWMCINSKVDGSGAVLTAAQVTAVVTDITATSVTVQFTNNYGAVVYLVNNSTTGLPFMSILGYAVTTGSGYSSATDSASITARGDRTLSSEIDGLQQRADAAAVASQLVAICARPRGQITVVVTGNPKRLPGQIVQISDAQGTRASGYWLILSVATTRNGAQYTQELLLVETLPQAIWDVSGWDESSWGE